ncbi:MAG: glycosyltransferase family 2 protein [Kiritimatiellaeota bacterium]|nr:glycosyltransferase family 2 protein [Kiritimatiellota bacterium]
MKSVTIVIPVLNEATAIAANMRQIMESVKSLGATVDARILVVDDGSRDDTVRIVQRLAETEPTVQVLALTRNFGKEAAIHAGLDHASGDAVIVMDCDLQHPPALLPRMIQLWRDGLDVVEAYKIDRGGESWLSGLLAGGFYALFNRLAGFDLRNHSDFKLLDRKVVEAYCRLPERERFFRGLITWMHFPSARIPFEVPERSGGGSAWSRLRLVKYSLTIISSFSSLPLQVVGWAGALTLCISLVLGTKALYDKFMGHAIDGFATVILLVLILGSIIMLSIGVVGNYIARIYEEVKRRPSYLIDLRRSSVTERQSADRAGEPE